MRESNKYNRFFSNRFIIKAFLIMVLVFYISMFFGPWFMTDNIKTPNLYKIYVNDEYVGIVKNRQYAHRCLQIAKEKLNAGTFEITFVDANMRLEGVHRLVRHTNGSGRIIKRMVRSLSENAGTGFQRGYMLKIDNYMVALKGVEEVNQVLQASVNLYDTEAEFEVQLKRDTDRAFNVLTAGIGLKEGAKLAPIDRNAAGVTGIEDTLFNEEYYKEELDFDDFDLGMEHMQFEDRIEVTECYLKAEDFVDVNEAIAYVTQNQAKEEIYEIQSGDTLGQISVRLGIPLEDIIAMNDAIENENSTIHVGQELIISVPKAPLTVSYTVTEYREEEYQAETIYIDNDSWYTTKQVTRQNPSTGFRRAISSVTYHNGEVYEEDILKQEVLMEAVPKIVERGTQIPPTYIKPLYGGYLSSGFGYRSFRGGGYHYGTDWACPTGTTIYASSGGTVTRAGWSSSYGYVVYIQHPGGIETRYAHNSRLLVKQGQTVRQGQAIALSGNTGDSSGPHLHFEYRINGKAVNAMKYLD